MNYSQEEILAALRLIQNICKEQDDCNTCPFRTKDNVSRRCLIHFDTPNAWNIKNDDETWRAFQ